MKKRQHKKLIQEGKYVAEIEVEIIDSDEGWLHYLSLDDAYRIDDLRQALRNEDIRSASRMARVYTLTPVAL